MASFYSNGKLLITGEYLVLDGAKSLAVPTKYGQNLVVSSLPEKELVWESYTHKNERWLQVVFDLPRLRIISATFGANQEGGNDLLAENLQNILFKARELNPTFLKNQEGLYVKSELTFARNWGLGSSSTLINNVAQWAQVDAFRLQFNTFGGSAYDIACAQHNTPITYQLQEKKPSAKEIPEFNPSFKEQLFFVHLNKKQNSREGIAHYKKYQGNISVLSDKMSELTEAFVTCSELGNFEKLLIEHEKLIAPIIQQKPVQMDLFSDYFGQTKSLGAWGGDFILATGNEDTPRYFQNKGFSTVIKYQDMIL